MLQLGDSLNASEIKPNPTISFGDKVPLMKTCLRDTMEPELQIRGCAFFFFSK